ncbi:MAG: NADH-quinone oxidoreductase subunit L [Elusimicrobiota bacterium]|nr:NADH-quinone oxidoreductase subunit L [Elusimicrobiota bacterium]
MLEHAYLIPLIPFAASLIMFFGAKEDPHSPAPWIGVGAMLISLGLSVSVLLAFLGGAATYERNWHWFSFATTMGGKHFVHDMPIGVLIDGGAALVSVVVCFVSSLVQIYSIAYMHDDKRYKRYFCFVSFFTAAMLGLVLSSNLLVTFACWELMGLTSYLLIGFWFEREGPCEAQKKAFMTTKLGDSGLYLALLFLYSLAGSFQISQLGQFFSMGYAPAAVAAVIALGILVGAAGKSAQFPLFIWLPDAMQGPTPGSALIHAATMVAAGIYVVARLYFVFLAAPDVMALAAWVGCITAFMAAAMALVSYDIKGVLAFSTISQLGFMMCALGAGGYTAALFHLTTHAFFKALLFLGAGCVIHAVHTNDMREMGGLWTKLPVTFWTMLAACCAIAGLPLFSGSYSKDMILAYVWEFSKPMFWVMLGTALMTAFYMFRLIFLTFTGKDRDHEKFHHAHEAPGLMTVPLVLLVIPTIVSGLALNGVIFKLAPKPVLHFQTAAAHEVPADAHAAPAPAPAEAHAEAPAAQHHGDEHHQEGHLPPFLHYLLWVLVPASIAFSFFLYRGPKYPVADALKSALAPAFTLLERRWYMDDLFNVLVRVSDRVAALCFWVDANVVDRVFVDGWGLVMRVFAHLSDLFDALFVDRTVDGFGGLTNDVGVGLRSFVKDGQVQEYLMYAAIAFSLAATLILTR